MNCLINSSVSMRFAFVFLIMLGVRMMIMFGTIINFTFQRCIVYNKVHGDMILCINVRGQLST